MPSFSLLPLDIAIVIIYLIAVIAHGLYVSRGKESADDYFLAGRALPWYLIGFSLFASNMSGASFIGLMGASYAHGIVVFNYEWTATIVLIFFAVFMLPHFLRSRLYTIPEYLERRFDVRSRTAYSVFTVLAIMFIDTAGALYAGGIVLSVLFPAFDLWQTVAFLALLAGIYTMLGGLKAVVVTDAVQAVLLTFGGIAIFAFGLHAVGGWSAMMDTLSAERRELIKPIDDPFLPWPGILGVLLLGFYYWTLNQFIVQRALGAASLDQGRKGALFAGFLKVPNIFIMILPGAFAVLLYPDLPTPDLVFPTLAFDMLPVGFRGLVLTALIAAIMSSLDSALNAAATLVTIDFIRPKKPQITDVTLVRIGRIVTGVAMIIGAVYAPMIARFETLFEYFQSVLSYVTPPIVAVFLAGIFWRRMTAPAAFWTIIAGLSIGAPLFILKEVFGFLTAAGLPDPHYTYMGIAMFVFALGLITIISLTGEAPDYKQMKGVTYSRETLRTDLVAIDAPWYSDFRYQSAGVLTLLAVVIAYFW